MCKEIWKLQIRINFREPKKESDALAIACFMFVLLSRAVSVFVSVCCLVPLHVVCSYVFVILCVCCKCVLWSVCGLCVFVSGHIFERRRTYDMLCTETNMYCIHGTKLTHMMNG